MNTTKIIRTGDGETIIVDYGSGYEDYYTVPEFSSMFSFVPPMGTTEYEGRLLPAL